MTRRNVVKKPAPSIRAASSRSLGIDRKYCRIRKMFEPPIAMTITRREVLAEAHASDPTR